MENLATQPKQSLEGILAPKKPNQKQGAYTAFSSAVTRGDEMSSSLSDFAKQQMSMTPQDYYRIYNQMSGGVASQTDINNAQARNSNSMAGAGLANTNLNSYENERIRQQIGNQYAQQNFTNYMGMQDRGLNTANSLSQLGYSSGNSLVSGLQGDERLDFEKQQYDDQNDLGNQLVNGLIKGGVSALGGAIAGPAGAYIASGLTDSLFGGAKDKSGKKKYELGAGGQYQRSGTNAAFQGLVGALG
jgi:hypothetical protein